MGVVELILDDAIAGWGRKRGDPPARTRREADTADNLRETRCGGIPPPTRARQAGEGPKPPPMATGSMLRERPAGYEGGTFRLPRLTVVGTLGIPGALDGT